MTKRRSRSGATVSSLASESWSDLSRERAPHPLRRVLFIGATPFAPMAAVCFEALALPSRATVTFAPRRGKPRLTPALGTMMREVGVHAWRPLARSLDAALIEASDLVITIGRPGRPRDPKLPAVPRRHEHWSLGPRTSETTALVRARKVRDTLRERVAMLVFMEGWGRPEMSRETERRARPTAAEGHHPFIPMRPFRVQPLISQPH